MPVSSDGIDDTDSNDGPHCRNCHVGASNCDVCHADDALASPANFSAAYSPSSTEGTGTNYASQSYLRQSAVADLNGKCIDGGFSFPHRTLGANMLKDELFGVDFDGTPVAFGDSRSTNGGAAPSQSATMSTGDFAMWTGEKQNSTSVIAAVKSDNPALENTAVENMDSVCIDCHGDATYYNDSASVFTTITTSANPDGTYGAGEKGGWELLLKGLP